MYIKVDCIYNNRGAWCKNKNVKRSLFGIGARCCPVYTTHHDEFCSTDSDKFCKLQEQHPKPGPPKGIK